MASTQLTTSDGHRLQADLARPSAGTGAGGAVVLCHPHPRYGGDRFNPVVTALFDALPRAGYTALRFDFRRQFGEGVAERHDVVAALDHLDDVVVGDPELPRYVVGYSFGAMVALGTADPRIAAIAAVAPPWAVSPLPVPDRPVLVLCPRHDQFSPPERTEPIVAGWPAAELQVIESADHFLAGHTGDVAARVVRWLRTAP